MDAVAKRRIVLALTVLLFFLLITAIGVPGSRRRLKDDPFTRPKNAPQLSEEATSFDTYLKALAAEEEERKPPVEEQGTAETEVGR